MDKAEKMYVNEIENFLNAINNESLPKCLLDYDYKVLELVENIETVELK
jgi:hydroxypyruvate isomerase